MNKLHKISQIVYLVFACNFCFATAPVIDESENFAIRSNPEPEEQALAHDDTTQDYRTNSNPNDSQIAKLLNQLQDLQQTVQELRGQIDHQNQIIDTIKTQQLTLYKDLDQRLNVLKTPNGASTATPPPKTPATATITPKIKTTNIPQNPADEQIGYMAAYNFIKLKEYSKAELALQDFIKTYPQSGYAANAEYWLGELYLQKKNYAAAMAHFENVINNFPASNKHAASLYKLGISLAENGQIMDAKSKYQMLIQQYPDSDLTKLAQAQLNKL